MELQQLLKECKKGSVTAQKYLFDMYSKQFFLLCRRYLKTNEQAEEVLMTGFLKIFSSLSNFTYINEAATIAWMQKVMVNQCLQEVRNKYSFLQVAEECAEEVQASDDVLASMSAMFNLFVIEQMSHKEIAALLSISEGTSKSQLSKAKQMLKQLIEQQNDNSEQIQTR
jgi:DNA-directed RNA polymerase specialized sigma24 family protein